VLDQLALISLKNYSRFAPTPATKNEQKYPKPHLEKASDRNIRAPEIRIDVFKHTNHTKG
jgi:hypothetical protein